MKQLKEKEYEEFQQYLYNKAHGYIWTPDTLELICGSNDNEPEPIGRQILEMLGRVRNEHISHMTSDKHKKYVIRSLRKGETDLLKDFLYEAIFIPKGTESPARDIIEKPELRVYTDDFGTRKGLDGKTRELLTVVLLAALGGADRQVQAHVSGALKTGNTKEEVVCALVHAMPYMGFPRLFNALNVSADLLR